MAKKKNTPISLAKVGREFLINHIENEELIWNSFRELRRSMNRAESIFHISNTRLIPPEEISELLRTKYESFV